jgi:hypothetical protein
MVSHWQIVVRFLLRFKFRAVFKFVFVTLAFADMMIRYTQTATCQCSALPVHLLVSRYRSTRREGPAFVPPGPFPEVPSHGGICL